MSPTISLGGFFFVVWYLRKVFVLLVFAIQSVVWHLRKVFLPLVFAIQSVVWHLRKVFLLLVFAIQSVVWYLRKVFVMQSVVFLQNLVSISKGRAAGWCAVGNCFSLQKEHESAIKFFTRAVQVCVRIQRKLFISYGYKFKLK